MADLPSLPATTDFGAGAPGVEGDPLEQMQKAAREAIASVNKNSIADDGIKLEFKKYVLNQLKTNIDKMTELDKQAEAKKAEESAAATEEGAKEEEEDPFADIFGDDEATPDESTQEKLKIAGIFISELKLYKEKYLKDIRVKKEKAQSKNDEGELEKLLGKLDNV